MIILGIDPGTATTGYGVVRIEKDKLYPLAFDLIETPKDGAPEQRLRIIHDEMLKLFERWKPHEMAMEKVFFSTNRKTAIRVGQAQGVMLLSAAYSSVPVIEYAPGTIKKIVAGHGRADKKDVQKSVQDVLGTRVKSKKGKKTHFDNAADALAVALCHIHQAEYFDIN